MKQHPFARSVALALCAASALTSLMSCSPSAPEVRPTPIDSGESADVVQADSSSTDAERAPVPDATTRDAPDDRRPDFRLVLVDPPIAVVRGESAPLRVRIDREGGFDAPILIDLWGLPDTLFAQARESRVGDDVLEITVEASEDAALVEGTPFAVQASARGIRRTERTTISVR